MKTTTTKSSKAQSKTTGAKANAVMAKQLKEQLKKSGAKADAKKEPRVTVASFMRDLIKGGKSNEEVFAAAQKKFGIGEEKKHYPSWYRCEMRRSANAAKKAAAKKTHKAAK